MTQPTVQQRLQKIVEKLKLRDQFDSSIQIAAQKIVDNPQLEHETRNLESVPFVTIDNEDSRDLDQALYVEKSEDGWTVFYALADASFYVRAGSEIFEEALERGSSFYFPTFALPMLPESLSQGMVSLNPSVRRRSLLFKVGVNSKGITTSVGVEWVTINSRAKLSYNGVQDFFNAGAKEDLEWAESMRQFAAVGDALIASAETRGIIQFDRKEVSLSIDSETQRFVIGSRKRNQVEKWNEQISLLINTEGATLLLEHSKRSDELQSIYRVHEAPLRDRLSALEELIGEVCDRRKLDDQWRWKRSESLSDYLQNLPRGGDTHRIRAALQRQIRYTNRASEFTSIAGQHFALAVDQYARFSSPMREVVGIFTHKELLEAMGLADTHNETDTHLRERVIKAANDSKSLQKKIDKEVMLLAIQDLLSADLERDPASRERRTGTIIGIRPTRIYLLLDENPLELKITIKELEAQFGTNYDFQETMLLPDERNAPTFGVGDGIEIFTDRWDAQTRRFIFHVRQL